MSKQHSTLLPQTATMSNDYRKISSFRQRRNKFDMLNLFRLCRKDETSFDIVAETGNIVAKKRQQCRSNIRHCRKNRSTCSIRQCCFDIVAGMDGALLIVSSLFQPLSSHHIPLPITDRFNGRPCNFTTKTISYRRGTARRYTQLKSC